MKTKRLVFYALCVSVAMVLSYVESLIPFGIGVPGAKVGLPNIVTVLLLYTVGPLPAAVVSAVRIVLTGFMFGNLFSILYSASGFVLSLLVMSVLKRLDIFGVTGVSAAGGVFHNVGQLIMAACIAGRYVWAYMPVLLVAGVIAGVVIGVAGGMITGRLRTALRFMWQ